MPRTHTATYQPREHGVAGSAAGYSDLVREFAVVAFLVAILSACGGSNDVRPGELIKAARAGDADAVAELLDREADVDARDRNGATALVAAAYGNHVGAARLLVAAGADVKLVEAVAGANPLITLKRYSHLLDARVTEAAQRFDPGRVPRSRRRSAAT